MPRKIKPIEVKLAEDYPHLHKRIADDIKSCGSVGEYVDGIDVTRGANQRNTKLQQLSKIGQGSLHSATSLAEALAYKYMNPGQALEAAFKQIFPPAKFEYTKQIEGLFKSAGSTTNNPATPSTNDEPAPPRAGFEEFAAAVKKRGYDYERVHVLVPIDLQEVVTPKLLRQVVERETIRIRLPDNSFAPIVRAVRNIAIHHRMENKIKGDLPIEQVAADLIFHMQQRAASVKRAARTAQP